MRYMNEEIYRILLEDLPPRDLICWFVSLGEGYENDVANRNVTQIKDLIVAIYNYWIFHVHTGMLYRGLEPYVVDAAVAFSKVIRLTDLQKREVRDAIEKLVDSGFADVEAGGIRIEESLQRVIKTSLGDAPDFIKAVGVVSSHKERIFGLYKGDGSSVGLSRATDLYIHALRAYIKFSALLETLCNRNMTERNFQVFLRNNFSPEYITAAFFGESRNLSIMHMIFQLPNCHVPHLKVLIDYIVTRPELLAKLSFLNHPDDWLPNQFSPVFHEYVGVGEVEKVKLCITMGANVDALTSSGVSMLSHAIKRGHYQLAEFLIDSGASLKRTKDAIFAPIHAATSSQESEKAVLFLVAKGCDVNEQATVADRSTALHLAVRRNNYPLVELLLKCEANPNAVNIDGDSPLHWAARDGLDELCKLLINSGCDHTLLNSVGKTPSMLASEGTKAVIGSAVTMAGSTGASVDHIPVLLHEIEKLRQENVMLKRELEKASQQGGKSIVPRQGVGGGIAGSRHTLYFCGNGRAPKQTGGFSSANPLAFN